VKDGKVHVEGGGHQADDGLSSSAAAAAIAKLQEEYAMLLYFPPIYFLTYFFAVKIDFCCSLETNIVSFLVRSNKLVHSTVPWLYRCTLQIISVRNLVQFD
jgi:hypothetical protein